MYLEEGAICSVCSSLPEKSKLERPRDVSVLLWIMMLTSLSFATVANFCGSTSDKNKEKKKKKLV